MTPMLNIALRAARKAGDKIARAMDNIGNIEIKSKGVNDFFTETDLAAEAEIISTLQKFYPEHAILSEEAGPVRTSDSEYQWIIDPLDGTTNFIRGIPHFSVSIACMFKGRIEHAIVLDPIRDEEFTASRGCGAQLNGKRIRVSQLSSLEGSLLGTGIPFKNHCDDKLTDYCRTVDALAGQSAGIRRAGAASLDLAYVAAGRLDGFWELGLSIWDIAAGTLLITEAGGLISDISGSQDYLNSGNVVCGNPKCFKEILKTVEPILN